MCSSKTHSTQPDLLSHGGEGHRRQASFQPGTPGPQGRATHWKHRCLRSRFHTGQDMPWPCSCAAQCGRATEGSSRLSAGLSSARPCCATLPATHDVQSSARGLSLPRPASLSSLTFVASFWMLTRFYPSFRYRRRSAVSMAKGARGRRADGQPERGRRDSKRSEEPQLPPGAGMGPGWGEARPGPGQQNPEPFRARGTPGAGGRGARRESRPAPQLSKMAAGGRPRPRPAHAQWSGGPRRSLPPSWRPGRRWQSAERSSAQCFRDPPHPAAPVDGRGGRRQPRGAQRSGGGSGKAGAAALLRSLSPFPRPSPPPRGGRP